MRIRDVISDLCSSPMDTPAPPPAPPAPPAPPQNISASVDISSQNMNPPRYPPAAVRAGIEGTVILIIDVDANGNVVDVSADRSSRNRDLDRAAIPASSAEHKSEPPSRMTH